VAGALLWLERAAAVGGNRVMAVDETGHPLFWAAFTVKGK